MIAMALACEPKLLIADEPTTALDVTIQAQILDLMMDLKDKLNMGVLFITHDLGVVANICTKVAVMYLGQVMEETDVKTLFSKPLHPYTMGLIKSVPHLDGDRTKELSSIPGTVPPLSHVPDGCRFAPRCPFAMEKCHKEVPVLEHADDTHRVRCWHYEKFKKERLRMSSEAKRQSVKPLLEVRNLQKYYPVRSALGKAKGQIKAVQDLSFDIYEGETYGLVGESGHGKSTAGRTLLKLVEPTGGEAQFNGESIFESKASRLRTIRKDLQMIFQDPHTSLTQGKRLGLPSKKH